MGFNPDKFLAETAPKPVAPQSGGFNPDKFLSETDNHSNRESSELAQVGLLSQLKKALSPNKNTPEAALSGIGQGLTAGHLSQAQAASEPVTDKIFSSLTGKNVEPRSYLEARDQGLLEQKDFSENNPGAYYGGQLVGTVPSVVVSGGLLNPATTGLGRAAQAGLVGGAQGLLQNPGDTEGVIDPIQGNERIKDAGMGAALGSGSQIFMEGLGAAKGILSPSNIRGKAEEKAFKALGPYQRDVINNSKKMKEIGRTALDQKVLDKTWEKTAEKVSIAKKEAGEKLGSFMDNLYSSVDEVSGLNRPVSQEAQNVFVNAGVDVESVAASLKDDLINPLAAKIGDESANLQHAKLIDNFIKNNGKNISIRDAQSMKEKIGKLINWKRDPRADIPEQEKYYRSLYDKLRLGIEDAADAAASNMGGEAREELIALKKQYSNLSSAEDISQRRALREFANRTVSPSDYMAGMGGGLIGAMSSPENAISGGIKGAIISSIGNKLGRTAGNAAQAKALDYIAGVMEKNPAILRKYLGNLIDVSQHNPAALGTIVEKLSIHPDFKENENVRR